MTAKAKLSLTAITLKVSRAKEIIQSSIDSHESWASYRRKQGPDNPEYGDLEHHETCLREYAEVMEVLACLEQAAQAAGTNKETKQ